MTNDQSGVNPDNLKGKRTATGTLHCGVGGGSGNHVDRKELFEKNGNTDTPIPHKVVCVQVMTYLLLGVCMLFSCISSLIRPPPPRHLIRSMCHMGQSLPTSSTRLRTHKQVNPSSRLLKMPQGRERRRRCMSSRMQTRSGLMT